MPDRRVVVARAVDAAELALNPRIAGTPVPLRVACVGAHGDTAHQVGVRCDELGTETDATQARVDFAAQVRMWGDTPGAWAVLEARERVRVDHDVLLDDREVFALAPQV